MHNRGGEFQKRRLVLGILVFTCLVGTFLKCPACFAGCSILYSFDSFANDGINPYGSLTPSGSTFYGVAEQGGAWGYGTIFQINANGSGYQVLYDFGGVTGDGANPFGALTLSGFTLYGMTSGGGVNGQGVIFKINTDGSGYRVLHCFAGAPTDGANPYGSLIISGSMLYGMTRRGGGAVAWGGGYANTGAIFRINTDGSGYEVLYNFGSVGNDGAGPYGSLALVGSTLYGMTAGGGNYQKGVIFRVNMDGSGYGVLYDFGGSRSNGANPYGVLTFSGATLYGMTNGGGLYGLGTIFQINTDGSGYGVLHSFGSAANDGAYPLGPITASGATLYGMTPSGGSGNFGAIFQINTDGTGYQLLYSFVNACCGNNSAYPLGPLAVSGSNLCGTTVAGGAHGQGAVFSLAVSPASGLWQGATELGGGWMWLDWFGYFNLNNSPWINHLTLGWLYPYGTSTGSIWFWDPVMRSFWWTNQSIYPYLFRQSDGAWLFYEEGASNPRWFYNFKTGLWERD